MLAYDENGKVREFEEISNIKVCKVCHRLYGQSLSEQIVGMRERDYDYCPYCKAENGSSMSYDYYNSKFSEDIISRLKRKSLIKKVLKFCYGEYVNSECDNCNHYGACPGNCKDCLKEIHFPTRYPNGKKDYDCIRMLYFYICDYTIKYASEMLYLMRKSEALKEIDDYHVVSIGCGGCPDLMAFETYCHQEANWKSVYYMGIDVNEKWSSIHDVIKNYKTSTLRKTQFKYMDAVAGEYSVISKANVLVLQYVISHFYNTGQIDKIGSFFDKLIEKIITHKQEGKPLVILINDVNSNKRGRNCFEIIIDKLKNAGFHGNSFMYYFDYNIQNDFQKYGAMHETNHVLYKIPRDLSIFQPWEKCSSAQLLIEVWEGKNDN